MKKNNKGFMLAETVIVSTVVITTLVALYASVNRLYSIYNYRSRYYDIDGIYAIKLMNNYLFKDNIFNSIILNYFSNDEIDEKYFFVVKESGDGYTCGNLKEMDESIDTSTCESLVELYNIKSYIIVDIGNVSIYSVDDNVAVYLEDSDLVINETLKEYLEYLNNNDNYGGSSYLVIIEYGVDNNLYYSSLYIS